MKAVVLTLLLLPVWAFAQNNTYFSADGSANFGHYLQYTGYSLNISGNIKMIDNLYIGVATGAVQIQPFVKNLSFPLSGRLTFFTSNSEERVAPFGLFEVGRLFYKEKNFGDLASNTLEGKLSFFTGVGVKLNSEKKVHSFFAIGYSGFYYTNNQYGEVHSVVSSRPYNYRRLSVKVGIMLP